MAVSQENKKNAIEYLGLRKHGVRPPTESPHRKDALLPGEYRPVGHWIVSLWPITLPGLTYFLLSSGVFQYGSIRESMVDNPLLLFGSMSVKQWLSRPGNVMVLLEAVTAWMMVGLVVLCTDSVDHLLYS